MNSREVLKTHSGSISSVFRDPSYNQVATKSDEPQLEIFF